jgi:hypothetical protein
MNTSAAVTIGNVVNSAQMVGYISNVRVVKGTALYTSSFPVPTSPLTAVANTSLLTCNSATIVDNSSNNFTITNNNGAMVSSAVVPFTSLSAAPKGMKFKNRNNSGTSTPTGNSVLFNGTNQYLSLPNTSSLNLGSNNFTMEAFVYISNVSGNKNIFYINGNNSSYSAICLYVQNSRFAFLANQTGGYPWTLQIGEVGPTISSNTWYHIATTRSGNSFYVFVNGTLVSGAPYSLSGALFNGTTNSIGYQASMTSNNFTGYISNARIINGTALYTASFTVPTAPLTAIANTALLTCNSATIVDNSSNNLAITNNNSATVSSTTPFTVVANVSSMKMKKVFSDPISYMVATGGDLITTSGSYKMHTFTTVGTSSFTISSVGSTPSIEYLVVGGGGGGGGITNGGTGGGGGGQVIYNTGSIISAGIHSIIVGDGGVGGPIDNYGGNGQPSYVSIYASAIGGGGGAPKNANGAAGANGGGGGEGGSGGGSTVGGFSGASGGSSYNGGGGGGAGANGSGRNGGNGVVNSILGTPMYYGGGGAGGEFSGISTGGLGGGGNNNSTGSANTGGGGSGTQRGGVPLAGFKGGSGIVIIKYRYTA